MLTPHLFYMCAIWKAFQQTYIVLSSYYIERGFYILESLFISTGIYFIYTLLMVIILFKKIKKGDIGLHGARTLRNGVHGMIAWLIGICLSILLNYFIELPLLIWSIVIGIAICSSTYRITEIKHLVDGQSTSTESNRFFTLYFWTGIISCLYFTFVAYSIGLNLHYTLLTLIIIIVPFLLGMGDVLQTRGINEDSRGYIFKQSLLIFIDLPLNILKALFIKKNRILFLQSLTNNLCIIYKGVMYYIRSKFS